VFVAWPPGRSPARRTVARAFAAIGAALAVAAVALAVLAPGRPAVRPATDGARVTALSSGSVRVALNGQQLTLPQSGLATRGGVELRVYTARHAGTRSASLPTTLTDQRVAALNGGRLPIGLRPSSDGAPVRYTDTVTETVLLEPGTQRIVAARSVERVTVGVVRTAGAVLPLSRPIATVRTGTTATAEASALLSAKSEVATLHRRSVLVGLGWTSGVLAALALLVTGAVALPRRREPIAAPEPTPVGELAKKLG
jgi:high-affinity iron transporter